MRLPRLTHAVLLETPERVTDGAGGFVQSWRVLGTLWAEINPRGGRETAQEGMRVSRVSHLVVVRGAPIGAPDRPKPEQRFRMGARVFVIRAVKERDPDGRYLICHVDEEAAV